LVVWLVVLLVVCAPQASSVEIQEIEEVEISDEAISEVTVEAEEPPSLLELTDLHWTDALQRHSVALRCVLYCECSLWYMVCVCVCMVGTL
jgi:hypothetical protein